MQWHINKVDRHLGTGGIKSVYWIVSHEEYSGIIKNDIYPVYYKASKNGSTHLNFDPKVDPELESFIQYETVTKEDILNWIWSNGVSKEDTELEVMSMIEKQKNPDLDQTVSGLPWTD